MRIWKNECVKVWLSPAFWLVLAVLLLINGVLLYTKAPDEMLDTSVYQKAYAYYLSLSEEECYREVQERTKELEALLFQEELDEFEAYAQYVKIEKYEPKFARDAYQEYSLLQEFEKQLRDISGYEAYLEDIQEKAKGQSGIAIFQNESRFSRENARKTAAAFAPLAGTRPVFVNSHTFHDTVDFSGDGFSGAVSVVLYGADSSGMGAGARTDSAVVTASAGKTAPDCSEDGYTVFRKRVC